MTTSESIAKIADALLKAQKAMGAAKKDAENPHFKSMYADLSAVIEAVKGPLNDHGIFYTQEVISQENAIGVLTRLWHSSGEWMEFGPIGIPLERQNAHGVGSATTYAKRYALAAICGLPTEDDDGNAASAGKAKSEAPNVVEAEKKIALEAGAYQILRVEAKRRGRAEWPEILFVDSDGVAETRPVKADFQRGGSVTLCQQVCQECVPVRLTMGTGKNDKPIVEAVERWTDNAAIDQEIQAQDQASDEAVF